MTTSTRHSRTLTSTPALLAAALFVVLGALSATAAGAADTYTVDPTHSNIGFSIRHFFSKVPGHFKQYEGTILYDTQDLTKSSVSVTIDTASIDTGVEKRDADLKSANFFDVEKYPKITFVSTKVTPAGAGKAKIEGTLTIRGVSKPVTLDVDLLGAGPDAWGGFRAGFEARTKINRQDYGVSWNKVVEGGGSVLSDDVEIVLNVEGIKQAPKPAEAPKK
jgi:polyisoprenoid-binding protein YceI